MRTTHTSEADANALLVKKILATMAVSGISKAAFCKRSGKNSNYLTNLIKGRNSIRLASLDILGNVLRVDPAYLADHSRDASPENIAKACNDYFIHWAFALGSTERKQLMLIYEELHCTEGSDLIAGGISDDKDDDEDDYDDEEEGDEGDEEEDEDEVLDMPR